MVLQQQAPYKLGEIITGVVEVRKSPGRFEAGIEWLKSQIEKDECDVPAYHKCMSQEGVHVFWELILLKFELQSQE